MVQLITALITLICVLIALALFAGAFYLAKHHTSLQHRVNVLEDSYAQATEHIQKQEEIMMQLNQQIEMMERENRMANDRPERSRAWNPSNIMNTDIGR
jgi:phage shock protein A